jgi:hypothetical protein
MKFSNKQSYKTSREVKTTFRNFWNLVIPAGTACYYIAQGGFHLAATPTYLADPALREQAEKPESLFKHDASYYWLWLSPDDVEPCA